MATGVACSIQLCGQRGEACCTEEKGGGKTVNGIVGREEKEWSSNNKGLGGTGHCEGRRRTTKGSKEGSRERVRGLEISFAWTGDRNRGRWGGPTDGIHIAEVTVPERVGGAAEEVESFQDLFRPDHPHWWEYPWHRVDGAGCHFGGKPDGVGGPLGIDTRVAGAHSSGWHSIDQPCSRHYCSWGNVARSHDQHYSVARGCTGYKKWGR